MIKVLITIKTEQVTATIFPFKYILRDENEGKYQSGDCWLIQYQIIQIIRILWQTAGTTSKLFGVKGLSG